MTKHKWRKLKCKRCFHWNKGNPLLYPNGSCLVGNSYGAVALEHVKTCNKKVSEV